MLTLILYSIVKEQIFYDSLYTIYYMLPTIFISWR